MDRIVVTEKHVENEMSEIYINYVNMDKLYTLFTLIFYFTFKLRGFYLLKKGWGE